MLSQYSEEASEFQILSIWMFKREYGMLSNILRCHAEITLWGALSNMILNCCPGVSSYEVILQLYNDHLSECKLSIQREITFSSNNISIAYK